MIKIHASFPRRQLSKPEEIAVIERVKGIISSGMAAKFTRRHRLTGDLVVKIVTDATVDEDGDLKSNNGYVAPWDQEYTIEEIDI